MSPLLDHIDSPADLRLLSPDQLEKLAEEIREELVGTIQGIGGGGHLASNLGVVELTLALHRQFDYSISPAEAAEIAAALRIRVYTIGVVQEGDRPRGFSSTTIDAELLTFIAEHTGARYFEAATADDLAQVYDEIASLETSRVGGETFARHSELGLWFVAAGAVFLLGELALGRTWLRRTPA